jgi:hypothetical protein
MKFGFRMPLDEPTDIRHLAAGSTGRRNTSSSSHDESLVNG